MVPLRLRLTNFLSYGEDAPVLDLEDVHVACLSGGNGQGKSALLDAMTWAVWGEARKSSEARKPDEELLRIGARAMEVDFTFRTGDAVHRVVRSYSQSASGKTSKPGLELQVQDGPDWRTLTAGSIKETQAAVDGRVGIDYETFINSTFLLQGRSDEFTKKKPGERKEILGKILALDRYERMAGKAGQRWSALRERASALEAEAERLTAALEPVGEWEEEKRSVIAIIKQAQAEVEAAATGEAAAARRLAGLDAAAREADALRAALQDLDARAARGAADLAEVDRRAAQADALVAQADAIEAEHARYETLRADRAAFDEKAALFRGIENQRHALRLDVARVQAEAEREVDTLQSKLDALDRQIEADTAAVAGEPEARAALARAEAASSDLARLDAVRAAREAKRQRVEAIDKLLAAEQGTLEGQHKTVVAEGKRLAAELKDQADVDPGALDRVAREGAEAAQKREALREQGTEVGGTVKALDDRLGRIEADRAKLAARRAKLEASDDEACPTCGTALTDAHRAEVLAGYDREAADLDAARQSAERDRARAVAERDRLRAAFAALGAAIERGEAAARDAAAARDRAERRKASEARLDALRAEVRRLGALLADEAFRPELRAERTGLAEALAAEPYDEAAHQQARADAALREHWAGQVRTLAVAAERLAQAGAERERRQRTLRERRAALDAGAPTADARHKLAALDGQADRLGYDPAAHERAARDLDQLADAPRRLSSLLDARRQRADLAERRARLTDDQRAIAADAETRRAALDALADTLAARADAERDRDAAQTKKAEASGRLAQAQGRLGGLQERLDRAERDRQRRAQVRSELRDVKRDRALYGHLRRAFGKNGIPSLIIEETLPEIETRANVLLQRLSKGQTRVALETLKDKKTGGGTKETLDIRITDGQGVARSYETFSGGEAFRVNFALRIALSQMLAERSGTQIRTLVIDEGFGTQDAEGLQSLIGAINAIQDDFETILVITHLDELKDAFPVRIEVRKEPVTGSTFDVIGG